MVQAGQTKGNVNCSFEKQFSPWYTCVVAISQYSLQLQLEYVYDN